MLQLDFKWKPGKLDREPGYPAPYQPRLDWQMWFAALGGYQQNVWFISLVDKLLENCKSVVNLMDVSVELKAKMNDGKMKMVKATKYQYDFTRVRNKWNQKVGLSEERSDELLTLALISKDRAKRQKHTAHHSHHYK